MLTILEVGSLDDDRVRELRACPDPACRNVLVKPDRATWTEAQGRELIVEHVEAGARWSGGALRDLVQLHRPGAIVCGWPGMSASLVRLAAVRLVPRPALVGVVRGRAETWWDLQSLGGFDAVFVDNRRADRRLRGQGIHRIHHVPAGIDLDVFCPMRRAGDRMMVALALGDEVDAPVLRCIHAALRRVLAIEPGLVILDRSAASPRGRLARFADGFEHVHLPGCSEPHERAKWLATCELAVILPGSGSLGVEAMACGLPCIVVAGSEDRSVSAIEESGCGRVLGDDDPDVIADAIVQLSRSDTAALGQRARGFVEQLRLADCLAHERACLREVIDRVRGRERHELK